MPTKLMPALPAQGGYAASSRALQAAARVAARYAHAPSYSQILAAEPQVAQRAGALESFDSSLPRVHEATPAMMATLPEEREWTPVVAPSPLTAPCSIEDWESEFSHLRREPDLRLLPLDPVSAPAACHGLQPAAEPALPADENWQQPVLVERTVAQSWESESIEPVEIVPVEPDMPIHANLIEFPRELVAARKMRPRRAEGPLASAGLERQLSIFEVDPSALCTEPSASGAALAAWPEPDWSGIELEDQPREAEEPQYVSVALPELHPAPIAQRLLAAMVDGALIAAAFLGAALMASASIGHAPATGTLKFSALAALLLIGVLYQAFFLTLAGTTPGMRYADLSLCTFDGQIPTQAQLRGRLGALLLSLLPVGLGAAWVLFDDDHLSWHDRLSRTYPRQG